MEKTNWPLLLSVVGVVFGGFGLFCLHQVLTLVRYARRGQRAEGRVSKVERHESGGGRSGRSVSYHVTVAYEVGGRSFEIGPAMGSNPPLYRKDERLPVYYFPERPAEARLVCRREYGKWLLFMLACFALVGAIAAIALSRA
jgi:hypothetical protein